VIQEGLADIVVPNLKTFKNFVWEYAPSKAPVFYNPVMEINRDIAVLVFQTYQKTVNPEINISEPLAGCGVRGIRFAKEVNGVKNVYLNDINPKAFKLAEYNINRNNLAHYVSIDNEDANLFLSKHAAPYKRFDCIDIDPFGTPSIYIENAIRSLRNSGLLALTATDLAPLCGIYPKVAFRKYKGIPLRTEYCHEIAVRLLSSCLATIAMQHKIGIRIIFSHSTNHYIRVYALLNYGARKADETIQSLGYILHCYSCFHRETIKGVLPRIKKYCSECGSILKVAGPLWLDNIADKKFCEQLEKESAARKFKHKNQVMKILYLITNEANESPTYYVVDKISDKLNLPVPPLKEVIKKLEEDNFKAVATHFNSRGIKTNAEAKYVIEAIKSLIR
jgi:tRNA (guanine26-N2/guanine27-N2)-dimethyltransferase